MEIRNIVTDVLVIGGGMAGSLAAIKAKEQGLDVTLVEKGYVGKAGASQFAGGYLLYFDPDTMDLQEWTDHVVKSGNEMADISWVHKIALSSKPAVKELESWGIKFFKDTKGGLVVTRNGSVAEVQMYRSKYMPVLRSKLLEDGVRITDRVMITSLLVDDEQVNGALGFHTRGQFVYHFKAKAVVVAAGNGSFKQAGLPNNMWTNDGYAMAYRVGAAITGKEFNLKGFGPIVKFPAWRGHGMAVSRTWKFANGIGDRFLLRKVGVESDPTLLEKMVHQGKGPIYWDLDSSTSEELNIIETHLKVTNTEVELFRAGIDIHKGGLVELAGAAWTGATIQGGGGGIWPEDKSCSSKIKGLYSAGDCCGTRSVGSNYPGGGFALGHAAITGSLSGVGAARFALSNKRNEVSERRFTEELNYLQTPLDRKGGFSPQWVLLRLQDIVIPYYTFHLKSATRMEAALTMIEFMSQNFGPKLKAKDSHDLRLAHELKNMLINAEMMLRSSLYRKESRGGHYREDYPEQDDSRYKVWLKLFDDNGSMSIKEVLIE